MKKFLCMLLTVAMLITAVVPVMAIDASDDEAVSLGALFGEYMPEDPWERILIWKTFKAYMLDGNNGINTVIKALNGEITLPDTPATEDFNNVIDVMRAQSSDIDSVIFALNVYKSVPLAKRQAALDLFGADAEPTVEITKTALDLTAEQEAAALALYEKYIDADAEDKFYDPHELTPANFLQLLTSFKGEFKMTNGTGGKFVLAAGYSSTFASNLATNISETTINGVSISSAAATKGYDILCGIVEAFNSFNDSSDRANLKIVLVHPNIDLYEANITKATRPSSSEGGSVTGGSGYTPKPEEPKDTFVDDSSFEIAAPGIPTVAPTFPDTVGHWSEDYVRNLAARGIILGDDDGNFRPDMGITRQEVAVLLVRGLGLEKEAAKYAEEHTGYGDHGEIADWAIGAVNLLTERGIYTGYDDGEFKPKKIILRQELVALVMRHANNTKSGLDNDYIDGHEIHGYAEDFVSHASDLGIIAGYPDETFRPLNSITRAEAAKVLYGAFKYFDFLTENRK